MAELRKYGVGTTIVFPLITAGGTDYLTGATDAGTDCQVIKDEGTSTTATNDFVEEGRGYYSLALTATEMQAARIVVTIIDAATKAYEDQSLIIDTYGNASAQHAFDLDTASVTVGTNSDKTGYSISGTKTTLDALNDITTANVNTEVADVLKTDTVTEQSQGAPPAAPTLEQILSYLYTEYVRNKVVVDTNAANQKQVFADDGSTILYEKNLSNASNVTTIDEAQTGA